MRKHNSLRKLPETNEVPISLPNETVTTLGNHFKTYNYHTGEFTGIDIYIKESGYIIGRLRYRKYKLYLYKTEDRRILAQDSDWVALKTNIKPYIDKRKKEGSILPIIEEDPTREKLMRDVTTELDRIYNVEGKGLSRASYLLSNYISDIIKHEIKGL